MEPVVALTRELIAIDSVSPSLDPSGAGESAIAGVLADRLGEAGFQVHRVEASDPRRPSIVAVRDGSRPGRSVVLNGHLDTVPVVGMAEPFTPRMEGDRIEGERLYGRGASDMKGGVAGLVIAAEELAARDAPGRVIVALVADEEDGSIGAEAVLAALPDIAGAPDVCLIAEPTWLEVASAHRGYQVVRVELTGRAAHSSQPHEGLDVIPVVGDLLTRIAAHDLDGGSLMATVVHAGSAPFTVAAAAELTVERRTMPGEPDGIGLDEVRRIVADAAVPSGMEVTVHEVIRRSPWELASTGPSAELAAMLGDTRRDFPYWMETALWEEVGIPALVCGPAGGGLHAVDEWVDLGQLRACPGMVVDAVERFLRS